MKTLATKGLQSDLTLSEKSIKFNTVRARVRSASLLLSGAITAGEAEQSVSPCGRVILPEARDMARGRMAARGVFDSPVGGVVVPFLAPRGYGALIAPPVARAGGLDAETLRGARAGLLTLAEVESLRAADGAAAVSEVRRLAVKLLGQTSGRGAFEDERAAVEYSATGAALAHIRAVNAAAVVALNEERAAVVAAGGELVAGGALGAGRLNLERDIYDQAQRIIAAVSVKREPSAAVAAENERAAKWRAGLRPSGLLSAYEWALLTVARFNADQVRAAGKSILRDGLSGRVVARGANLSKVSAKKWMRSNSRREAANLAEVGGAAGVDDRQAWSDWSGELAAISKASFVTAAAVGAGVIATAFPPCHALVLAGLGAPLRDWSRFEMRLDASGEWDVQAPLMGSPSQFKAAIVGRGKKSDWPASSVWDESGRKVDSGSLGRVGRGVAWLWAGRAAGKAMHSARYGHGGRDGREVAACWSANGTVSGAVSVWWEGIETGAAFVAPVRSASRRPSFVVAIRAAVAADLREARAGVVDARAALVAAVGNEERETLGGALGVALVALRTSEARAKSILAMLHGERLGESGAVAWVEASGALTGAGRKAALRFRKAFPAMARKTAAKSEPLTLSAFV